MIHDPVELLSGGHREGEESVRGNFLFGYCNRKQETKFTKKWRCETGSEIYSNTGSGSTNNAKPGSKIYFITGSLCSCKTKSENIQQYTKGKVP